MNTPGMIRAIIDGEAKYGWYCQVSNSAHSPEPVKHFLIAPNTFYYECDNALDIADAIEIPDLSLCAVATGKMAKGPDGKVIEIYGSRGEMQGGDRVNAGKNYNYIGVCEWLPEDLTWIIAKDENSWNDLSDWPSDQLTILPRKEGKEVSCGVNCHKVVHLSESGFVHGKRDDKPYNIDGCWYCGRCHTSIPDPK